MRRRDTGRWNIGLTVALVTGTLGLLAQNTVVFSAAAIGLGYAVYGYASRPPTVDLDVERALSEREPLYDWASRHGVFGDVPRIEVADFDLNEIPTIALVVSVVAGYVALVALSIRTWTVPTEGSQLLSVPVSLDLLLVGYATLTLVLLVISAVGYLHFQRLARQVDAGRVE